MENLLSFEILEKTFNELSHGVGIFHIDDLNDLKSIRYVYMNKIILYEMRKNRDEVFGKRIIEVAPEAYQHEGGIKVIETYRDVAATGKDMDLGLVEYSNHMVAGIYYCSVHHIQDNYVYVMLKNVTELEQTKSELEQKNEELQQFASVVAHDLKSPVNSIYGLSQLIQNKLDERGNKILKTIIQSTQRMRIMIDDLLDYSRIGYQKEMTKVNCNNLLENVQEDLSIEINKSQAIIEVRDLPTIMAYITELRLLFQNLIANAIKFQQPGTTPKIEISAEEKGGWTFTVKDNGIGISDKHKDKIFNIFQRLHLESAFKGSGIGLAHCKKIVELHKGKIWFESIPDEGSSFYFNIPTTK